MIINIEIKCRFKLENNIITGLATFMHLSFFFFFFCTFSNMNNNHYHLAITMGM